MKYSECFSLNFCELFYSQLQKNPEYIAVVFENSSYTYKELDKRSTLLAKHLKYHGIQTGDVVALGMNNCLDLVVGVLGIFKSGAIYFPIDPYYPSERINSMIDEAKPKILLTSLEANCKFLNVFIPRLQINNLSEIPFEITLGKINIDQLAYIVFTSGSTGRPKGIVVDHKALSHAALAYQELHPDKPVSLLMGSISFDPSILIIVFTLVLGGTIIIPQNRDGIDIKNPENLIPVIENNNVSFLLCTPSVYSVLLKGFQAPPPLKNVDLCGENISVSLPKLHKKIVPNATLHNVYGPSEYAMGVSVAKIYDPITKQIKKITIGRPFSKNEIFILDENFQMVSQGVKGEIFIGGPGLAKEYLNQKKLTKKKFVQISFFDQTKRLYRTGDMGRYTKNENIEFLGRNDDQVKNLSHRVELGEIEYAICQHSEVDEAKVIFECNISGKNQLIAYFSTINLEDISTQLKAFIEKTLPSFMLPSQFIYIENWPYTPNGKVDRRALKNIAFVKNI